jgi:hypothetical protein
VELRKMSDLEQRVEVRSMYGARTGQPIVVLVVGEHAVQITPAKAREIAAMLFECAEGAESDAFIARWVQQAEACQPEQVAALLLDFRQMRAQMRAEQEPS